MRKSWILPPLPPTCHPVCHPLPPCKTLECRDLRPWVAEVAAFLKSAHKPKHPLKPLHVYNGGWSRKNLPLPPPGPLECLFPGIYGVAPGGNRLPPTATRGVKTMGRRDLTLPPSVFHHFPSHFTPGDGFWVTSSAPQHSRGFRGGKSRGAKGRRRWAVLPDNEDEKTG